MICPKCKITMNSGKAIESKLESCCLGCGCKILNSDTLKIIDCWKCSKCGHSEEMKFEPFANGWLLRQLEAATRTVESWPKNMQETMRLNKGSN